MKLKKAERLRRSGNGGEMLGLKLAPALKGSCETRINFPP